jgi:hypothetical protein
MQIHLLLKKKFLKLPLLLKVPPELLKLMAIMKEQKLQAMMLLPMLMV